MSVRSLELLICYTYVRLIHRNFFFLLRADLLSKGYLVHHTCNLQIFLGLQLRLLFLPKFLDNIAYYTNTDDLKYCRLLQKQKTKTSELSHETSP